MNINLKAPDVYQVQAAPTNGHDVAIKVASIIGSTAIVLGVIGLWGYLAHTSMTESNKKTPQE